MKLTRQQEEALISYALNQLLGQTQVIKKAIKNQSKGFKGKKWTDEQRARFSKTMKAKWRAKKNV